MSKVFSDLKPRNTVGRNGFDLSRRSVFSAKCGQITPCFCQATVPDGEYSIDVRQLLRTQPLQTAAFTGFSVNYDFFFVPNNYGYSSFNEFISQRADSRHVGQPPHGVVPKFDFRIFMQVLIAAAVYDYMVCEHFNEVGYVDVSVAANRSQAHFCCTSTNMPWASLPLECIRSLDMFGYGNYLPMVKLYADSVWRDLELIDSSPITFTVMNARLGSYISQASLSSFMNVLSAMIAAIKATETSQSFPYKLEKMPNIYPTVWPFLSYNKAFYEYYRNSYYDMEFPVNLLSYTSEQLVRFDYVQLFNFDDFSATDDPSADMSYFARLVAMIVPKQHLYKKDLFTGVLPSTQFGDVSVMIDNRDWLNIYGKLNVSSASPANRGLLISNSGTNTESLVGVSDSLGQLNQVYSTKFRFDPGLAISVLEQRRADSMQRFKERMMRAGNKVKDIFKAHGWSEPYSANESSPIWLGTFDGRMDINTVAATTGATDQELGQLAANGSAVVSGKKIHFKCHDFGYIVGVFYVVKDAEYDAYGVERQHCLVDPFDYPYPELQNISLFPIDTLEVSSYLRIDDITKLFSGDIVGYLPRFMEYKTALDKVHGEFYSAPLVATDDGQSQWLRTRGVFADWVTPREDLNLPTAVSFLYQQPNIADNVFLQASKCLQSTDPFLINCLFDVMAVEPISVIGLPI